MYLFIVHVSRKNADSYPFQSQNIVEVVTSSFYF